MKKTSIFSPNRPIFFADSLDAGQLESQKKQIEQPNNVLEDPRSINSEAKNEAAKIIAAQQLMVDKLETQKLGALPEPEFEAQKFSEEELNRKTKGYPELKSIPTKPINIQGLIKEKNLSKTLDHGDTSNFYIDLEDEKGEKEYIILMDKSAKTPKLRLFKQS